MVSVAPPWTRPVPVPEYRGYAFDLDGTIYLGERLIPGADALVAGLRDRGARVVFVTNKPLDTAADYAAKLSRLGIPAEEADIVTALDSVARYLDREHPGAAVLPLAEPLVVEWLAERGRRVTDDPAEAEVVLVSFDRTFDYDKLQRGFDAIRRGAALVGTNPDPYCPTPEGGLPDCGALLAALETATGVRAAAVLGKPSRDMAECFLDRLGVPATDAVMVGDRLLTDIAMAREAGMRSALVLSGATSEQALLAAEVLPDHVLLDVTGLSGRLAAD